MEITQEIVKFEFNYKDGELFYKQPKKGIIVGNRAGCHRYDGYRVIRVDGVQYYEHRVIFLYHHGYLPRLIDHIDMDKNNNDIGNLRSSNKSLNAFNTTRCKGKSGLRGVYWAKNVKKWRAFVYIDGKHRYVAYTDDFFEACCRRKSAEQHLIKF